MSKTLLEKITAMTSNPDLVSKKWIYEQYDSAVMNDTVQIKGDAAVVRIHDSKKAIAVTTDCTPRYVEADPFEGAKQAVVETYRNISAVGATPLAITNCLNFGNPEKPEIMGQIVKAIQGITEASKKLNYPVVSGNVSLYNETDGSAIKPTPAIGAVGLLKDVANRCSVNFKSAGDEIFVIGKTSGHLGCSIFEREIQGVKSGSKPPHIDLEMEKKNSNFVSELIQRGVIRSCHDVSDGGLFLSLFEKCFKNLNCELDFSEGFDNLSIDQILFAEDQARFIITVEASSLDRFLKKSEEANIDIFKIGVVTDGDFVIKRTVNLEQDITVDIDMLKVDNESFLENKMK